MYSKRCFDILCSAVLLLVFGWVIIIGLVLSMIDTKTDGIFIQKRIGQYGKPFNILKLRTINPETGSISSIGKFLRRYKIDEMPQFINVLSGSMSMVGPRPDVPGYYDILKGDDRDILNLKPGITGPATLKYANEEELLRQQEDPEQYNKKIIFPDKIRINKAYLKHRSIYIDIKIIIYTILRKKPEEDYYN